MTVQIEVDEKLWAETKKLAKELGVNFEELFLNTVRSNLYMLKNRKERKISVTEKEKQHRESYEKYPVTDDEFFIDGEHIEEAWKDL